MEWAKSIEAIGYVFYKAGWPELSSIINDAEKSSQLQELDYNLAGLLSYAAKERLPNDLSKRFHTIRSFDKVLEEARQLSMDNDLCRAYVSYLDMKRSWLLHHYSRSRNGKK